MYAKDGILSQQTVIDEIKDTIDIIYPTFPKSVCQI